MPSFEEEAFTRAQQMNRRTPFYGGTQNTSQKNERKEEPKPKADANVTQLRETSTENTGSLLDIMFKNKEQSLILLLIVLLMDEKADSTLLLALIYLLT